LKTYKYLLAGLIYAVAVTTCYGQAKTFKIEGVPVAIGDSIESVRSALNTTAEAQPMQSAISKNNKELRLRTRGLWVFFDDKGAAYNVRLDAPFAGSFGGVKIGDSYAQMVKLLGEPVKTLKMGISIPGQMDPVLYYPNDNSTLRFNFDRDGQVETVMLLK
jgi:hypothetical protein